MGSGLDDLARQGARRAGRGVGTRERSFVPEHPLDVSGRQRVAAGRDQARLETRLSAVGCESLARMPGFEHPVPDEVWSDRVVEVLNNNITVLVEKVHTQQ